MPNYYGFSLTWLHNQVEFEAAVYHVLEGTAEIPTSRLLFFRHPKQSSGPKTDLPRNISGRQFMLFDMPNGDTPPWRELNETQKVGLASLIPRQQWPRLRLTGQAARSRAALLNKPLPAAFVATWRFWTSFQPVEWMPKTFPLPPAGNRDFCIAMLKAKGEGLICSQGDRIGWEEDELTVGPLASAAKQSLLRLIPLILPEGDDEVLYRLVLQHDDFGLHNISVDVDEAGELSLTSVYDWETGCIIPVILTEIGFSIAGCDLIVDEKGEPSVHLRSDREREPERSAQNQRSSADFLKVIYEWAPYLKRVLHAGNDARRLWSTLKRWKGDSPEEFFGELGSWAEARMSEMRAETPGAHQPVVTEQAGIKVEKTV